MALDPEIAALSDNPQAKTQALDPEVQAAGSDTSLPDSYRAASQNNADHVSQSQEISKRRGIDPNFALANLDTVKKADDAPDFDALKQSSPTTHKLVSDPKVMGKAWDDIGNLQDVEGHAQTGKKASTLLQAALAGFQGSGSGMALRGGLPDVVLGEKPPFAYEAASAATGMVSDLPEMIGGGALGALTGGPAAPFTAGAAGFALPAAFRQALIEHYTHGNVESAKELLRRSVAIAIPAAKQGLVGLAMAATGGGAAALGAGSLLTKGAEVAAMTTAGAAVEGKYPTARDLALNGIMLTGAHVAGITWDRMGEAAQASKLRARDPETFAGHADSVSGPAYIPADKFDAHFGPDTESMVKKLGIEKAYTAAKASGGDVEIPAGKYLSAEMDAHREALHDDVKSDPEAQTINQVKEADEQRKAEAEKPAPKLNLAQIPKPDPASVNVRVIHHGETSIDSSGEPTPEEKAQGILPEPQTHGPKFKSLSLTEKGREQVQQVAEDLKDQNISRVVSGGSQRTLETGSAIAPTVADERFAPLDLKADLDGMPISEYKPILKEALDAWAKNPDSKQLGNESFNDFQNRNIEALKAATQGAHPGDSIGLALSSDSVQLFKLIAENGGQPISGDLIKRMAEKEKIKPASVDAYKVDANGVLTNDSLYPKLSQHESESNAGQPGEGAGQSPLREPLQALPASSPGPTPEIRQAAEQYARSVGLPVRKPGVYAPVDAERGARIAAEFEALKHDPQNPAVKSAYDALIRETLAQYQVIKKMGVKIESIKAGQENPYAEGSASMIADVRAGHMWFFPTEQGFGSDEKYNDHPLFSPTDEKLADGTELKANDVFRIVHDFFGHAKEGIGFGARGEENAWQSHMRMFSPEAAAAMTTETRGQNSWVNFGPHGETNRADPANTKYADQKAGLLPSWVSSEGLEPDKIDPQPEQTPREQREQATAQAVSSAQQEIGQSVRPIQGIDPKSQAELDKMQDAARKEAEKILLKPQLEELKTKNRALIDAERERVTAEVGNQVGNEPVFRAYALFNPEGVDHEISQKTIWKKSVDYMNDRMSEEDKLHFETVAEMSGFGSADEMAQKLLVTERGRDFQAAVKARVDQHMTQFADLKDTTAMREEALKSVHTEQSGQALALQYQIMEGMAHNAEINAETTKARRAYASERWEAAKQMARDTISSSPVETAGRFRQYITREREAAVRAEQAWSKGDWQESGAASIEQLHNHALAAESLRARDDIDTLKRSVTKQQQAKPETWKDQDHFVQAADIMKRFGFEREDYDPSKKTQNLSDYADRMSDKAGEDAVNIPDWIKDESVAKDWRKLTLDQFKDVRNTLKNIKHLANTEDVMQVLSKGIEKQALVNDLVAEANKNVNGGHTPGADPRADFGEKMWNATERWGNVTYAVETMLSKLDGWKLGGKWGEIVKAKSEAQDNEAARKAEDAAWWDEANKHYTPKELIDLDAKKIYIPEIRDSLSKRAMMVAIGNTGTESNERVLKDGRGWSDDQIDAIKRRMDKRDFDTMQALLDRHEDNNKPALAEMAKRRSGFEPKWIEAQPIQTPYGEYRGGYMPLIRDNRVSSRGMEESSLDDKPMTFQAATPQGMLKERNSHATYPVSLDINDQLRALNKVSHYLTMQDWVSDMNGLMNNDDIKKTIIDTSGRDRLNTINNWVKDVAGTETKQKGSFDGVLRKIADHSVISQLGTKLSVTLATGTHGIFAVGGVDPENFGPIKVYGGLMNFLGGMVTDPLHHFSDAKQFMLDNSKYMAQHAKESEGSIEEAADRMAGKNRFSGAVRDFAFSTMHGLYNLTITPIWNDAYKTGLTIKDGDHDAAVSYANMIVRGSSPPGRTSDIPTMMHDSSLGKLMFLMHGFADRQYQMMIRAGGRYGVQVREAGSPVDVAKATSQFLGTYANVLVIPGMAMAGLKMIGSNDSEREHKILQKHIVRSLSPLTTLPVISTLQDMAIDAKFGTRGNANLSAVGGAFDSYQHFVNETASSRAANEQKLEAAAKVASFAVPYPQAVNDGAFNLADIVFNGMNPRASDLIRRRPARERGE